MSRWRVDKHGPTWRLPEAILYLLTGAAGVFAVFHPTLLGGFGRMQAERGDTIYFSFILEHQFRSLFWPDYPWPYASPPFFYPIEGGLHLSETMVGTLPLYALLRGFLPALLAFQCWDVSLLAGAYLSMLWLLRRFDLHPVLVALGAFVFGFGMAHGAHMYQQILLPALWGPLALGAWFGFRQRPRARGYLQLLLCLAGQLLCSLQLGWFLCLGIAALASAELAIDSWLRLRMSGFVAARWRFVAVSTGSVAAAVIALCWPFVGALGSVGWRRSAALEPFMPRLGSWFQVPRDALMSSLLPSIDIGVASVWEHELFPGVVPLALGLFSAGLWWLRRGSAEPVPAFVRACLISAAILVVVSLFVPLPPGMRRLPLVRHGGFSLWWLVFDLVPTAQGIRRSGRDRGSSAAAGWRPLRSRLVAARARSRAAAAPGAGAAGGGRDGRTDLRTAEL